MKYSHEYIYHRLVRVPARGVGDLFAETGVNKQKTGSNETWHFLFDRKEREAASSRSCPIAKNRGFVDSRNGQMASHSVATTREERTVDNSDEGGRENSYF
jgi:hypothetical protein